MLLKIYESLWAAIWPFLPYFSRLRKGLPWRRHISDLEPSRLPRLWIQAASVGEAYLAVMLVKALKPEKRLHCLVTTWTDQGLEVLKKELTPAAVSPLLQVSCRYFPLDRPRLMDQAVNAVRPVCAVMLETEIWPGFWAALKKHRVPILVVNARLSPKSLRHLKIMPRFWRTIAPRAIAAVSAADAQRFKTLFPTAAVTLMPNMKFEQQERATAGETALADLFPGNCPLVVFGSIRQAEEKKVLWIVERIRKAKPDVITVIFPRHAHRQAVWLHHCRTLGHKTRLRSHLKNAGQPARRGEIIIWDVFGELKGVYTLAGSVFVGGSLARLGGQNFIEPLVAGVRPIVGPHTAHFDWVGACLFDQKLVRRAADESQVLRFIMNDLENGVPPGEKIRRQARLFLKNKSGGTACAIDRIKQYGI